jgi:hypothetical protein
MKLYFFSAFLLFIFWSCKKNEAGGKAQIQGTVAHHSKVIGNALVYIKYGATEFPGKTYSDYDTYVKADAGGNYSFNCYKGDYFLYAVGIDSLAGPKQVDGGVPVHIRAKEVVKADIAVSEEH